MLSNEWKTMSASCASNKIIGYYGVNTIWRDGWIDEQQTSEMFGAQDTPNEVIESRLRGFAWN